jgi:Type II secretion system (T2SS), protein E, N-terminal domain
MRNETAIAPTRDLLPRAEVCQTVEMQATISEAIQQLANSTKIALVTIQLSYGSEEKTGHIQETLAEQAAQSTVYLLQNIRPLVRKTDLVFLHQHRLYFVLLAANLEGGAIVEERLWEALLWRVHNISEQKLLPPDTMTIGHSAYPDPHPSLSALFESADQVSRRFSTRALSHRDGQTAPGKQGDNEELPRLARKLGVPYLSLLPQKPPQSVLHVVNARLAQELRCYPVGRERNTLTVAMTNPQDRSALERLRRETGLRIFPVLTHPEALARALEELN